MRKTLPRSGLWHHSTSQLYYDFLRCRVLYPKCNGIPRGRWSIVRHWFYENYQIHNYANPAALSRYKVGFWAPREMHWHTYVAFELSEHEENGLWLSGTHSTTRWLATGVTCFLEVLVAYAHSLYHVCDHITFSIHTTTARLYRAPVISAYGAGPPNWRSLGHGGEEHIIA